MRAPGPTSGARSFEYKVHRNFARREDLDRLHSDGLSC